MEPEFEGLSPRFTLKPKDVDAVERTSVRLECRVTGAPTPEVRWYRDNEPLIEGDKYQFDVDDGLYSLVINDVTEDDSGHYKVIARNSAGREHATADVTVKRMNVLDLFLDNVISLDMIRVILYAIVSNAIVITCDII